MLANNDEGLVVVDVVVDGIVKEDNEEDGIASKILLIACVSACTVGCFSTESESEG